MESKGIRALFGDRRVKEEGGCSSSRLDTKKILGPFSRVNRACAHTHTCTHTHTSFGDRRVKEEGRCSSSRQDENILGP